MYNIYRGSYLSWFSGRSSLLVKLEFGDVGFCGGGKSENPEKNPRNKARTENKLNPYMPPGQI